MQILDDVTLIQQFVGGEATLAANQNLRIESAFDSVQLLAKRGGLIASMKQSGSRQTVFMRRESDYAALMHQILLARQFVPTGDGNKSSFEQYWSDEIPAGYEISYTTARTLWKEWWRSARHTSVNSIQMDLLIFVRDTWYPVRNIVCSQGILFITTLVSEVSYECSESLTWLHRTPVARPKPSEPLTASAPQTIITEPLTTLLPARSHQPSSSPAPETHTADNERRSLASTPSSLNDKRGHLDSQLSRPDLRQVLRFRQGKLYITTALGDIVVEGSNLKFHLDEAKVAIEPQKPISLHGYRDRGSQRESQAVSL